MEMVLEILFGCMVAGLGTALLSLLNKKVGLILLVLNMLVGALGAVSANQLLMYGPTFLGMSVLPMTAGSLVLAGLVSYVYSKMVK